MNNKFVVNLHCMNHDHCPQHTGSALQYHLVLRDRIWTGRLHLSRSQHWLPVVYQAGGLLYHYSVLQRWSYIGSTCMQRNEQTSSIRTFSQTAPTNDSSCYPWIQCTTCWETDWSHLMCEGDRWLHRQNGNVIVLKQSGTLAIELQHVMM